MINNTLSSYTVSTSVKTDTQTLEQSDKEINSPFPPLPLSLLISTRQIWLVFAAAVFLVSVPVFIEAPLVRSLPWLSVALTGGWVWLSFLLMSRSVTYVWGDLIYGFSWSWLAGSIYWGWLRWEPLWHLPVESIGLPIALWCLRKNWGKIGHWFYLGSLFGTVLTDVYFYLVDLMPYWRQIMQAEPEGVSQILHNAVAQVQTPGGQAWALILGLVLMTVGIIPLRKKQWHWYAFSGAVLSTIFVDSLFLLAAVLA